MESLSPLVRNTSARRLSLELVHKFANNLLPSPTGRKWEVEVKSPTRRRASEVNERLVPSPLRRASLTPHSPLSPFNSSLGRLGHSPLLNLSPNSDNVFKVPSKSPCTTPPQKHPQEKTSGKVTCNVIPATPRRRSSLCSFLQPHPHSSNKENDESNEKGEIPSKRRRSSITPYDLGQDFPSAVEKSCDGDLQLDLQDLLGRGSFGTVLGAKYKGKEVAVKILRQVKKGGEGHLEGELNGLALPPHPHIVSVYDVLRVSADRALVILERMERGNLLSLINDPDMPLPLKTVVDISAQVASALNFCHKHGILHLDVKPQNILFHRSGSVKLSDFGNSKTVKNLQHKTILTKLDGTVGYKAPELFRGDVPTEKCDVYSLAITMWQLMSREQPYLGETEHSVIYKVVAHGLRPKAVCNFYSSRRLSPTQEMYVKMYEKGWNGDPNKRQSMGQLHHQLRQLLRGKL